MVKYLGILDKCCDKVTILNLIKLDQICDPITNDKIATTIDSNHYLVSIYIYV